MANAMAEDVLYIELIWEHFSCNVSSGNHEEEELTVIGTPKTHCTNFLKRRFLEKKHPGLH